MRRLIATTVLAAALTGPTAPAALAAGHDDRPGLLDFISIDLIVQRLLQSGIMALRTQMDLQYSDMAVDYRTGTITIADLDAWPLPEWDENGDCQVSADRATIRGGAVDVPDRIRGRVNIAGLSVPQACLPPDMREGLQIAGLQDLNIPRLTIELDYGMPGSDALIRAIADVEGAAAVDLSATFAYIWFDGREDMEEPMPVMFLENATIAIENKGLWQNLQGMVPPPFTSEGAGLVVEGALGEALIDMNRDAAGEGGDTSLNDAQRAFLKSVSEAWPAFLANPETLVIETALDSDVYIDVMAFEDDPRAVFDTLQPRVALKPSSRDAMVDLALLRRAIDSPGELLAVEAKEAGMALVTGSGAPRNLAAGRALLEPLAAAGDGGAAIALARALSDSEPVTAYGYALSAGRAGEDGATALLDRLERRLDMGAILAAQESAAGGFSAKGGALDSVSALREAAAAHLAGRGATRSYAHAATYAALAKAAGDLEAADILADIEERMRLSGDSAQAAWAPVRDTSAETATRIWLDQDMPSKLGD